MGWGIDHLCVETQRAILSYPVAQQELRPPVETQEFKVDRAVVQRRTSNCGCATALEQCTNCTYFTKIIVGTAQEQWHTTTGCLPPPANRGVMVRHPSDQRLSGSFALPGEQPASSRWTKQWTRNRSSNDARCKPDPAEARVVRRPIRETRWW